MNVFAVTARLRWPTSSQAPLVDRPEDREGRDAQCPRHPIDRQALDLLTHEQLLSRRSSRESDSEATERDEVDMEAYTLDPANAPPALETSSDRRRFGRVRPQRCSMISLSARVSGEPASAGA